MPSDPNQQMMEQQQQQQLYSQQYVPADQQYTQNNLLQDQFSRKQTFAALNDSLSEVVNDLKDLSALSNIDLTQSHRDMQQQQQQMLLQQQHQQQQQQQQQQQLQLQLQQQQQQQYKSNKDKDNLQELDYMLAKALLSTDKTNPNNEVQPVMNSTLLPNQAEAAASSNSTTGLNHFNLANSSMQLSQKEAANMYSRSNSISVNSQIPKNPNANNQFLPQQQQQQQQQQIQQQQQQ
jgi:hypothetical protein